MRLSARIFFIFLLSVFCFLFTTPFAHAQVNPYIAPNTDANVPANLHTYTQSMVMDVLSAVVCQMVGVDPITSSHQCLGYNPTTGKIGYVDTQGGALGFMDNMVADLYTPAATTKSYVQYMSANFGLVKHTYASTNTGTGFTKLSPLIGLWTTFRDITYLAFVVVFIVIGFAIMVRHKIDPRTVMTIENQIPKIIIALVMVTFSYAIAGFMIDMMYVTTYLGINAIANSQGISTDTISKIHNLEQNDLNGGNPLGFMNDSVGLFDLSAGAAGSVKDIISNLFYRAQATSSQDAGTQGAAIGGGLAGAGAGALAGAAIGAWFGGVGAIPGAVIGAVIGGLGGAAIGNTVANIPEIVGNAFGALLGIVAGLAAFLIIAIAILWAMFRVWFSLLGAYVSILLNIVFAPFVILLGLLPGSKIGFGSWVRDLAANLLAFPVTAFMFLLAKVFMDSFTSGINGANGIFVPPLIGNPQPGNGAQSPVAYLIALGFVLMTPTATNITRGFLKVEPNKNAQSIFQAIGKGTGTLGKAATGITNSAFGSRMYWDAKKGAYGTAKGVRAWAMGFGLVK